MDLIPGIEQTASALEANKLRLQVVAENIAHANTTRTDEGGPYQRKSVSFQSLLDENGKSRVAIQKIAADPSPGPVVHQPSHPHADQEGMVRMPNVSLSREMVDMISASRAYEANLSVARTSRDMASKALRIGQ